MYGNISLKPLRYFLSLFYPSNYQARVSVRSQGCPGTHFVDLASLEITESLLIE